jgi:hypothetical protein
MFDKKVQWVLRVALFGTFFGHGIFALEQKASWFKYFEGVGITNPETIGALLVLIGIMDVALAIIVLLRPVRLALLWMAFWGFWTAFIRWPLGPDPIWDFVERWANWGAPLALLMMQDWPRSIREWFR